MTLPIFVQRHIKICLGILLLVLHVTFAEGQNKTLRTKLSIIVHKDNNISEISKADLKRIFLKKRKVWPEGNLSGEIIHVINQPYSRNITQQFCKNLLSSDVNAIKKYWTEQKYKGGELHPLIQHNTDKVITSVSKDKNSIAYAAANPGLKRNQNIRILAEFEIPQSKSDYEALLMISSLKFVKNFKKSVSILIVGDDEIADAFNYYEGQTIEGITINNVTAASTLPKESPDVLFVGKNSSISSLLKYASKNRLLTMTNSSKIYQLGTNLLTESSTKQIQVYRKNLNGVEWDEKFTGMNRKLE